MGLDGEQVVQDVPDSKVFPYSDSVADTSNGVCCAKIFVNTNEIAVDISLISSSQVTSDFLLSITHRLSQYECV